MGLSRQWGFKSQARQIYKIQYGDTPDAGVLAKKGGEGKQEIPTEGPPKARGAIQWPQQAPCPNLLNC
jgi:hypothetical protein